MFVGETGVARVIQRTLELMKETDDVTTLGGIPLDIIQKYINRWVTVSMDLFGGEDSSNAATYFAAGLKGRYRESSDPSITDHVALEGIYPEDRPNEDGTVSQLEVPLRRAMNLVLRDSYRQDCMSGFNRWNRLCQRAGVDFEFTMPSERFNRRQGVWANLPYDPAGTWLGTPKWEMRKGEWLPTPQDETYIASLMKPVYEPGKIASWIAPPKSGINHHGFDFEYVKFADDPYVR